MMTKLELSIPGDELESLQHYAKQRGQTVSELISGWARRIAANRKLHPDLAEISGILPVNLDAQDQYHRHLLDKHQ